MTMEKLAHVLSQEQNELIVIALKELLKNSEGEGTLQIDLEILLARFEKRDMVLGSEGVSNVNVIVTEEVLK